MDTQPTMSPASAPGKKPPVAVIAGVAAAVLVLGIGGFLFAAQQGGPAADLAASLGLPAKSGGKVILEAIAKTQEAESATLSATMTMNGEVDGEELDFAMSFRAEGMGLQATEDPTPSKGTFAFGGTIEGEELEIEGEFRAIDDMSYVSITKMSEIPDMPFPTDSVTGKWFYFEDSEEGLDAAGDFMPADVPLPRACEDGDPAQIAAFLNELDPDRVFAEVKSAGSEDGASVYEVTINEEEMEAVMEEYGEATDCDLDDTLIFLDSEAPEIKSLKILVAGGMLRGFDVTMEMPEDEGEGELVMSARLTDYDKEVMVEEPEDAQSFEEFLTELIFGSMDNSMMFDPSMMPVDDSTMMYDDSYLYEEYDYDPADMPTEEELNEMFAN